LRERELSFRVTPRHLLRTSRESLSAAGRHYCNH
jgi:hypothetical protein